MLLHVAPMLADQLARIEHAQTQPWSKLPGYAHILRDLKERLLRQVIAMVNELRPERLERMILFGESMLRRAAREYLDHYHGERNHQGLENRLIDPGPEAERTEGTVVCRKRLGGLLRYDYRHAA
jgi:hypothetical protein